MKTWRFIYRTVKAPRLFSLTISGTRAAAECNFYLRHARGDLPGVPADKIVKIEAISEIKR